MRQLMLFVVIMTFSCTNSVQEIDALLQNEAKPSIDIGKGIVMKYSDSARVQVIIEGPTLEKHNDVNKPLEVFPDGVKVSFLNDNGQPGSWLEAEYAVRNSRQKEVVAQGNVNFYNRKKDRLQTYELIWDEKTGKVYTNKFIKLTRPMQGDTLYGIGFETDQSFDKVVIKNRNQGKMKVEQ